MTLYHFTSTAHLPTILSDGYLRPSESNVGSPYKVEGYPHGNNMGPDVVWLLNDPDPSTFSHGLEGSAVDKRGARISVEVDKFAIRWLDWEPATYMAPDWREVFIRLAGGEEAAGQWFVLPAPIRAPHWSQIALLDSSTGAYNPMASDEMTLASQNFGR